MFSRSSSDANMPAQHSAFKATGPLDHQSNVGAYHTRCQPPSDCATA